MFYLQTMDQDLVVKYIGCIDYSAAFKKQLQLHARRVRGNIPDTLLLLEHPHIYTLGRHADENNIILSEPQRKAHGVDVLRVDRGGDVTYHGPGQLMGYPIIKLDDWGLSPRRLVEWVEMFIIQTLFAYDIEAYIHPDLPGVWVGDAKICAIGMRIKDGVSYHGFALNISTDLSYFDGIIPCGIQNKEVCSMESLLGHSVPKDALRALLAGYALEQLQKCRL